MRLISWNVNGLRAVCDKGGFRETFAALDADFFCLQETQTGKVIQALQYSPGTNRFP